MCAREKEGDRGREREGGGGRRVGNGSVCVCVCIGGNKSIRVRMGERVALTEVTGNE